MRDDQRLHLQATSPHSPAYKKKQLKYDSCFINKNIMSFNVLPVIKSIEKLILLMKTTKVSE